MSKTHRIITITTDPAARPDQRYVVALSGVTGAHLCGVPTQADAERFADGLAYGLRLGGFTVRIDIAVADVCGGRLEYETMCGMRVTRDGQYRYRCPRCGKSGETTRGDLVCDAIVPDAPADEPLDFAMFGETEGARPAKAATTTERDPVEVRLERDRTAEFYKAEAMERRERGL